MENKTRSLEFGLQAAPTVEPQLSNVEEAVFHREPGVPAELSAVEPSIAERGQAGGLIENPEFIFVDGKELRQSSSVKDLREGCMFFGINQSGSKKKLFERLCHFLETQYKRDAVKFSESLQRKMAGPQATVQTRPEDMPDEKQQHLHEVTHLPFASWCSVCARAKSREDKTWANADFLVEDTSTPVIPVQLDWCFLGKDCPALCVVDSRTRCGNVFPTTTKGAFRQAAEVAVKFSLDLGDVSMVVFVYHATGAVATGRFQHNQEPTTKGGANTRRSKANTLAESRGTHKCPRTIARFPREPGLAQGLSEKKGPRNIKP